MKSLAFALLFFCGIASAQVSEETLRLQALERIIASQNATINKALDVLKDQAAKQPVVIGGMAPAPQPVQDTTSTCDGILNCVGSLLLRAGGKAVDFLDRNAVPIIQLAAADRKGKRDAEANIELYRTSSNERIQIAQANASTNAALGMNMQNIATTGFNVFAGLPPQTVTTNNISGTGINFGNGTLTYAPISGSYNPTNPTARVCQATTTGLLCQ